MTATLNTKSFDLSNKYQVPLSPQLSQVDLVSNLQVLNKQQPLTPSDSTDLLSPVSPTTKFQDVMPQEKDETLVMVTDEHQKQNDVAMLIYFELMDLIYWEIPGRSTIVLSGILSSLILTRYYSLLYVCAGTLTILTGFNLIFVNTYNFIRSTWTGLPASELIHPYHIHIDNHSKELISRDLVDYYIHKLVDLVELGVQTTAKIVYVQDTKVTGVACLLSAFIYFATSFIASKIFFGLFVLAIFTIPYYYEEHQDFVDENITTGVAKTKVLVEQYTGLVQQYSITFYNQSIALVQKYIKSKSTNDNEQQLS
ncbi:Reticulon-domain-containing protein [Thamnidium elegans]|nr:Reticulon-domain-containing protein [Thamnidium elegans]